MAVSGAFTGDAVGLGDRATAVGDDTGLLLPTSVGDATAVTTGLAVAAGDATAVTTGLAVAPGDATAVSTGLTVAADGEIVAAGDAVAARVDVGGGGGGEWVPVYPTF